MAKTAIRERNETAAEQSMGSHGSFCWNELMAHDVQRAKKFYADTIGWTFDPMPMDWGTYWIIKSGDKIAGGMVEMKDPACGDMPENWMPYLAVDDVDARVKKAVASGASIIREPFDVKGVGRIAILRQPGGGAVGWMTPASPA
jgi:predicted enzyme related to lactoylglutathione lyase